MAWIAGALGVALCELYRYRKGLQSAIDLFYAFFIFTSLAFATVLILVSVIPRKSRRVFGPRHVRFPWYGFMRLLGFSSFLFPAVAFVLWIMGRAESSWILISLVPFVGLAWGFFGMARLFKPYFKPYEAAETIEKCLTEDPRPPVLYLRPFVLDSSLEMKFGQTLTELIGPLIALGNPQDYSPASPYRHAVREYATDSDWAQKLEELAHRSSCIVVEMAKSDKLRTEFEFLRNAGLQNKLFVFRFVSPNGILKNLSSRVASAYVNWEVFSRDLARMGYDLCKSDPGLGSVITFDEQGQSILLTAEARTAAEFVEPIKAWLSSHDRIGRCIPASCIACGREFRVFPPDIPEVRERWCRDCAAFVNWFERLWEKVDDFGPVALVLQLVCLAGFQLKVGWFDRHTGIFSLIISLALFIEIGVYVQVGSSNLRRIGRRIVSRYLTLAAEGDAIAMANLGILYKDEDEVKAASWFRQAAEAGDIGGMINLAKMYEDGRGGLRNDANQALSWYWKAANSGSSLAQRRAQHAEVRDSTA
jgi:hypothetical protein